MDGCISVSNVPFVARLAAALSVSKPSPAPTGRCKPQPDTIIPHYCARLKDTRHVHGPSAAGCALRAVRRRATKSPAASPACTAGAGSGTLVKSMMIPPATIIELVRRPSAVPANVASWRNSRTACERSVSHGMVRENSSGIEGSW